MEEGKIMEQPTFVRVTLTDLSGRGVRFINLSAVRMLNRVAENTTLIVFLGGEFIFCTEAPERLIQPWEYKHHECPSTNS